MISTFPSKNPPKYPLIAKFTFNSNAFELTLTFVGKAVPNLLLLLEDQASNSYEGIFSESSLRAESQNWEFVKFDESALVIQDVINRGNFVIQQENSGSQIRLDFWWLKASGMVIKRLGFCLRLKKKMVVEGDGFAAVNFTKKDDKEESDCVEELKGDELLIAKGGTNKKEKTEKKEEKKEAKKEVKKAPRRKKTKGKSNKKKKNQARKNPTAGKKKSHPKKKPAKKATKDASQKKPETKDKNHHHHHKKLILPKPKKEQEELPLTRENLDKLISMTKRKDDKQALIQPPLFKKHKKEHPQTQPVKFVLSPEKRLRVLHFTSGGDICPDATKLKTKAMKSGLELTITEDFAGFINEKTRESLSEIDSILVSAAVNINDPELFGTILMEFAEKGGTVVQIYRSCSPFHQPPKGRWAPPLTPKGFDRQWQGVRFATHGHPILRDVDGFKMKENGEKIRALLTVNGNMGVDLVGYWNDMVPLIGIRNDLKGVIVTMGFDEGKTQGAVQGAQLIVNALRLRKENKEAAKD